MEQYLESDERKKSSIQSSISNENTFRNETKIKEFSGEELMTLF